jgi:hypothetical protein
MEHDPWHKNQERKKQGAQGDLAFNNGPNWGLANETLQEFVF